MAMAGSLSRNGNITIEHTVSIPVEHAKASFEAMDANHYGKISMQEFIDYHTEFFFSSEDKLNSSVLYGPVK